MYIPDNWVILKIDLEIPVYKVLAGWSGGYLHGDAWRVNSGIDSCKLVDNTYEFTGQSGSAYACHKDRYGLRNMTASMLAYWQQNSDKIILLEDQDWTQINYTGL